ncbi:MAG: leucine-rich repeat protein [Bacteroidales bacterium]|nr:leucine-rich repeat protein [Bacteroidales bacterium]
MKKIPLIIAILLCFSTAWAYDFSAVYNGTTFYFNITSNTAPYTIEVTHNGYNNIYSGNVTIPSSVSYSGRTYSVTKIGQNSFYHCTNLTSVTIPNTVTSIGNFAFYGCTGLRQTNYTGTIAQWCNIDFGNIESNPITRSRNLYINNQLVTNLVIPNTVDTIKNYAFSYDSCITSVTIPNSVTSIGNFAFYGCTGLRQTNYTGTIAQWCNIDFGNIESNPITRSRNLYINNQLVTNLVIPNTVDTIKNYAFSYDSCITSVTIPNSVKSIGKMAFNCCTGMTSVTIPNSLTSIGEQAFAACRVLASVTIPKSVTSIGPNAFSGDTNLISVNFNADSCTIMGLSGYPCFSRCNNLRTVNYGNNVRIIPDYAFYGCTGLTSVTIRRANTTIGNNAFSNVSTNIPVYVPCGSTSWYRNQMSSFSNFVEFFPYTYSAVSCNNAIGVVTTDTAPTCNNNSVWTIRASANHGFVFSRWSDSVSTNPRTITVTKDTNLTAIFDTISYNVVAVSDDTTKGVVSGGGSYNYLRTATLTATANHGFAFSRWNDSVSTNPRTITVTKDTNLTAIFDTISYNVVAVSDDTTKGVVSGGGSYNYLRTATLTATANHGFAFSRWSDSVSTNPRTITVTQDTNLTAIFDTISYNVVAVSEDTIKGFVSGGGTYLYMHNAVITATANSGYSFSHWSDGDTNVLRTLTITQDTSLVAYFTATTPPWYTFSVVSEDTNKGTVQVLVQPTQSSPQATFVALPNNGYTFTHWSDGNTQNPRSLTVTQDTALVAYFRWYDFIVSSEDTAKGTVQVLTQPSQSNPQATLVALPNTGYTFSRWSDGNTQNPRSITVTQDTILIAFFTSTQGIAKAENVSITIYPNPASDKVTLEGIGNEADIFIINALGKVVRRLENAGGTITFSVGDLPKGIYFVRVGNAVRKLVVD